MSPLPGLACLAFRLDKKTFSPLLVVPNVCVDFSVVAALFPLDLIGLSALGTKQQTGWQKA